MSVAHYTDNPTDFTEHSPDGNQVSVDKWTHLTAHSRSMGPFGYLAGQASLTRLSPNGLLDDMTSNSFASVQGDSRRSSIPFQ